MENVLDFFENIDPFHEKENRKAMGNIRDAVEKLTKEYRGEIIELFTIVEMYIDDIICLYFCNDKKKEDDLREWIVTRGEYMSFNAKLELVDKILKKRFPNIEKLHKGFKTKLKDKVLSLRNIVAHQKTNIWCFNFENIVKFDGETVFFEQSNVNREEKDRNPKNKVNKEVISEYKLNLFFSRIALSNLFLEVERENKSYREKIFLEECQARKIKITE